jgi:hypothetical protein
MAHGPLLWCVVVQAAKGVVTPPATGRGEAQGLLLVPDKKKKAKKGLTGLLGGGTTARSSYQSINDHESPV